MLSESQDAKAIKAPSPPKLWRKKTKQNKTTPQTEGLFYFSVIPSHSTKTLSPLESPCAVLEPQNQYLTPAIKQHQTERHSRNYRRL